MVLAIRATLQVRPSGHLHLQQELLSCLLHMETLGLASDLEGIWSLHFAKPLLVMLVPLWKSYPPTKKSAVWGNAD